MVELRKNFKMRWDHKVDIGCLTKGLHFNKKRFGSNIAKAVKYYKN